MGKSNKILCVKMKNGKESLCVRMHSNGGDANCKCVSIFSQSWGEWKNVCVSDEQENGENPQNWKCVSVFSIVESTMVECACG